jgi:hypothetical protein
MTSPKRETTAAQRERQNEAKRRRAANDRGLLSDYVVTVTQEHFVTVRARDHDQAGERALREIRSRWGGGLNPVVTEVEVL